MATIPHPPLFKVRPPTVIDPAPTTPPRRRWSWQRLGGKFLVLSVAAHLLLGVVATYFVVQTIAANKKKVFTPIAGNKSASRALEHKVQTKKQKQTVSAPPTARRVVTTGASKTSLPSMPMMPSVASNLTPASVSGMGGGGLAPGGLGGAGGGMGEGGGAGVNFFGIRAGSGSTGLTGVFYDYKVDQGYQKIKEYSAKFYADLIKEVLPQKGPWHPETPHRHYTSPVKLSSRYFIYPNIKDTEAGAAFQSPRSGPGGWLAVYHGLVTPPASGQFRFVGFGDNVMIVKLGDHMVLDASDLWFTGQKRERTGTMSFPGKSVGLFAGEWFTLNTGEPVEVTVVTGDQGGIFCSGLFIQPRSVVYPVPGDKGNPKLPVFMVGAPSAADRTLLGKHLPPECLNGPYFHIAAPKATNDIFSH